VALVEQLKQEKTLEAIAAGVVIPATPSTSTKADLVSERIKDFIKYQDASGLAANTIRDFAYYLGTLNEHLEPKQMSEVTKDDLLGWAKSMRDQVRIVNGRPERLIADSTIWYSLRTARTFFLHFRYDILKRRDFPHFLQLGTRYQLCIGKITQACRKDTMYLTPKRSVSFSTILSTPIALQERWTRQPACSQRSRQP
jgi:hypothetical protein